MHLIDQLTCEFCEGMTRTFAGERVVLNVVTAVPEPTTVALLGARLLAIAWRGRRWRLGVTA